MNIPMKATQQIGLSPTIRFQTLAPNLLHTLRFGPTRPRRRRRVGISCAKELDKHMDELLAADLLFQINKFKSETAQRQHAFSKSKELLFAEMSEFAGLNSEDLTNKWRRMNDGEKWMLAKDFVAEWSAHYHPLSARSVKELVDEYVGGRDRELTDSADFFSAITKFFGFHKPNAEGF